jgi:para-nitrobenzyl esterase
MSVVSNAFGVLLFIVIGAPASAQLASCADGGPDIVCTAQGAIRGVVEGETLAFKGIPYAQPPIGSLRWRPARAAEPWQGVHDGDRYGAMCPQIIGNEVKGEEDCLYVNIWRPREKPTRPLPVMVWLTGGGNHSLSGQGSPGFGGVVYNGAKLVPQEVMFVSYNLRLGVLGFLAHPALDAERSEKISGNYGSLDQVAMLRWLQRNIAGFGGDPERVFLFGTSAGGANICALMTSPLTRGLINGVAMESSVPMGCEIQTLADAETGTGRKVVASVGCDAAADVAACLRGKSVADLVASVPGSFTVLPRVYGANMDGHIFPDQPLKLIIERKYPGMPVIIGNTSEETNPWANSAGAVTDAASYAAAIDKVFGSGLRDRIVALYPLDAYPTPVAAFARVTTDAEFTCQSWRVARALAKAQKQPVYRYIFAHSLENDPALKAAGVVHTLEHPFFFAWQGKYRPNDTDLAIQRQMVGYWTRMARTGNPNGGGDPDWPPYMPENEAYLEIAAATAAKKGPAAAHCDFWDSVTFPWPHL